MFIVLISLLGFLLSGQPPDTATLSKQARQALTAGQFDEAARIYRQLISLVPGSGGLRMNLGLALFNAGRHRAAAAELQTALKLDPGLAPAAMMLGLCHVKLGEPLAAIPLLEQALKTEPGNTVVLLELADAFYATGRFVPAIQHFRRLTELQPSNPTAWRGLGLSLTEHSQSLFTKLAPASAEALTLLARARLAADEPKAAFALLRQALERDPNFGPAHGYLAELYKKTGHADWATPELAKAGPGSGTFAEVVTASERALEAFARLAALPPSSELYETEAEAARARGAHPDAIVAWRKALGLKPGAANLERGLARALFLGRNYDEALPLLVKHNLTYELGESLLETGKAAEAIPHLLKVRTPAAQAALGRAYLESDQPAKAIGPLRAALTTDTDGSLHFQLARALQRTGAAAQARDMDRLSQQIRQKTTEQRDAVSALVITPP
ncbi:MAG: tetratricopeptide repeat protein [Bryobacteraceae bacterium]